MPRREDLSEMISIRLSKGDVAALAKLEKILPLKRITIARTALRLGIDALIEEPARLLGDHQPTKKKPKGRGTR